MPITEPTTMLTDYVLGSLAAVFAVRLYRLGRKSHQLSVRLWAAALAATAVAALVGGTSHGFAFFLGETFNAALWKATVYSIGLASFFLLAAVLAATFSRPLRAWLLAAAGLKFGVYAVWMATHDTFRYVVYDYVPAMVAVLLLQVWSAYRKQSASAKWIISGVLVSFAAAGIQQSGFALHRHFNHNDLYHVVQMGAVYLLYRGGQLLQDR